jgi:hypothetical protein
MEDLAIEKLEGVTLHVKVDTRELRLRVRAGLLDAECSSSSPMLS